ncbi:MAG: hypothetical protein I8H79_13020, partial [Burkholderiales bacterium]|nr:hypothetical protein [Burkholderiales bacterium]
LGTFAVAALGRAGLAGIGAQQAAHAGPFLALGELRHAATLLPQAGAAELAQAYGTAFRHLLYVLASITTTSALLILAFLRHPAPAATDTAALPACKARQ